jgi:hypothetical protein
MRRILLALLAVVLISLVYYLFIRSHEFEVNFRANTTPGDIIETIRIWNRSLDSATIMKVDSFSRLDQAIRWKNGNYVYNWHFSSVNDTVTKVNIQISEPDRKLLNKILVPFTNQQIEKDANEIATEFYNVVKEHLEITAVKVEGVTEVRPSFCVCRSLETPQIEKANGMMKDFDLLTSFIEKYKLKSEGPPEIRIKEWDHNFGLLKFDFCFPITKTDSLPISDSLFFKSFEKQTALKAVFHGNYITSDRAWYALIQSAEKNGYKITGLPIEHFHDNPNLGMNEKNWKAEVYLPIED